MREPWNPDFADLSPAYAPLIGPARELRGTSWPGCDEFNRLLGASVTPVLNASGMPLRFVAQDSRRNAFEDQYEPRVFLRGEVQLRPGDWHDLFNALVWFVFPRAKAALNACHFRALERQRALGARNRGPAQDALTLFDEAGVIVAVSDTALSGLLAGHAWKELFWQRRAGVTAHMRFCLFGHSLYAKMLRPFAGVTGRGVVCEVAMEFFALPLAQQIDSLDREVAARLAAAARGLVTQELVPVPLLGIPGWCKDNERADYYDNTGYFRPARSSISGRRR